MNVSVAEWMVIVDTLNGSAIIADRTDLVIFRYTSETRKRLADALTARLSEVNLPADNSRPEHP